MQTETVAAGSAYALSRAVELLRAGEIVALPTETVYGLAADAFNPSAVAKIFEAKERPHFNPLIVHLPDRDALEEIADVEGDLVTRLIERFWPGPLTIVLPKRGRIPPIVTAGLETVAVRMSRNPVFARIIGAFGRALAAPSANRFGHISSTSATHVRDELQGRTSLIVDGGATEHGIESTILQVMREQIRILRRGPVTSEMLAEFGPIAETVSSGRIIAPGQLPSHYAPRAKLFVVTNLDSFSVSTGKKTAALSFRSRPRSGTFSITRQLSKRGDLREAAVNLFGMLRELDACHPDLIVAELVPEEGLGLAINERLLRAAAS